MKTLTTVAEFEAFINTGDNVKIIDFYAEWCEPCQRFLKIADRVEAGLAEVGAEIAKVDGETSEIAKLFALKKYPTFIYWHKGQEQTRYYGIRPIVVMQEEVYMILDRNNS